MRNRERTCLLAIASLLVVIAIVCVAAFGQTSAPVQMAANSVAPVISQPASEVTPSTSALQARLEAQQQEINKLTALVEKLQTMLEPVASARAILPNTSIGFLPYPGGAPSPSPSPVEPSQASYTSPRELLPDIGHIGAELGFFVGGATNPYKDNTGFASGGYIDLPWKNVPGGKLSYEIMIGLQRSVTTQQTSSGVNALVDTALNNYLVSAGLKTLPSVTDYLTTPLPVTSVVQERSKVLTVAPFELKYAITKLGRFRPYVVGGLGAYVWIGSDNNTATFNANTALGSLAGLPVGSSTLGATLNAILQGSQIGGLAPTAPQLAARGVPHGQGNLLFGGQIGGGAEFRITPRLSLGADFRHNQVEGSNAGFNTFTFKQGFHW